MLENFLFRPIINFFTTDSNRSYKLSFLLLIGFVISLSLILINIGSPVINSMPWDVIIQFDAAWRVIHGQIPNVDFTPIIPPLSILLTAFGMKVAPPSASSIVYGNVLFFVILTPWAWVIARSRLSAANAFLFAVFMGVLLVAPRALGDWVFASSYAMLYNRQGWVLLSMLCVELFIFNRKTTKSQEIWSGLSSSVLLALLLFGKLSFFGIGVGAVLIRCFLFRPSIKWFITLASSFLLLVIAMQAFLPLNLFSYISDLRLVAKVYGPAKLNSSSLLSVLINSWEYILIVIVSLLILMNELDKNKEKNSKLTSIWLVVTGSFVIVASILLCLTSSQGDDIPFFLVAGLIYLEYFRQNFQFSDHSINSTTGISYLYSILLIIPVLLGTIFIKDISSIVYSAKSHYSQLPSIPEAQKFKSKTLSDFIIPEYYILSAFASEPANEYPGQINDGLTLLRKHISSSSRIFTLSFANPFPFALELPPASGGVINFSKNLTFNAQYFPDAENVFKGANMVMIPRKSDKQNTVMMKNLYKDYLSKNFIEKDNSEFWTLLVKLT
jgi:hypothetical protein